MSTLEARTRWDYEVPTTLDFVFIGKGCKICTHTVIATFSAPFLVAKVPYDKILSIIKERFEIEIPEEALIGHESHIRVSYESDEELKEKHIEDLKLIQSDATIKHINEEKVIDSCLRSLYAKMLLMQKEGRDTDDGYLMLLAELGKWADRKVKLKSNQTEDRKETPDLKDVIKVWEDNDGKGNYSKNDSGTKSN